MAGHRRMNYVQYSEEEAEEIYKKLKTYFMLVQRGQGVEVICEGIRAQRKANEQELLCFSLAHTGPFVEKRFKQLLTNVNFLQEKLLEREKAKERRQKTEGTYAKNKKLTYKEERELAAQKTRENVQILFSLPPLSTENLDGIDWDAAGLCHHIPGGEQSTGVFMVQVGDAVITLKPGSVSSPGEYFCSLLYGKLGLKIPRLRALVVEGTDEYKHMISSIKNNGKYTSEEVKLSFPYFMKTDLALVGEFFPNQPLDGLSRAATEERVRVVGEIGAVLALDLIMNNGDRIPFSHRGDGNPNNILLDKARGSQICFIDNTTTSIVRPKGREKYVKLVQEISEMIFRNDSNDPTIFLCDLRKNIQGMKGVVQFFRVYFQVELSATEKTALISGFKNAIHLLLDIFHENNYFFSELKEQTANAFRNSSGELSEMVKQGLTSIDPQFYESLLLCFES